MYEGVCCRRQKVPVGFDFRGFKRFVPEAVHAKGNIAHRGALRSWHIPSISRHKYAALIPRLATVTGLECYECGEIIEGLSSFIDELSAAEIGAKWVPLPLQNRQRISPLGFAYTCSGSAWRWQMWSQEQK